MYINVISWILYFVIILIMYVMTGHFAVLSIIMSCVMRFRVAFVFFSQFVFYKQIAAPGANSPA